jgi:hypothetical protein
VSELSFNKKDGEKFFKFIAHKEFTEVRIVDPREGLKEVAFVDNLADFLAICEKWNGKANIYVGVNERITKEGKAEHVSRLQIIPLDIDSIREKGQASTDAELEIAHEKMFEIREWLKAEFNCTPFISMSGNGYHILIKIPPIPLDEFSRPALQQKLEIFVHGIQEKFNDAKIHIDSTFDLPRVMKVPGTMSVKGDNTSERPWRMCQIVEDNDMPSAGVLNHLITLEKPEKAEASFKLGDKGAEDFTDLLKKDEKLRDLMEGRWEKYKFKSRSEAEQSIVTKLMMRRFSEDSIRIIMSHCKIDKWQKSPETYRKKCIQKAIQFVADHSKGAIEPTQYVESCGENLADKIFEQKSGNEFIVYDKTTGKITIENAIESFKPCLTLPWDRTIDSYVLEKATDYQSFEELWSEVKRFIYEHIDIPEGYDILTAWVFANWTPERWQSVPYLFFFGPKGSGKSVACEILAALSFRPLLTGDTTIAAVFRLIEMYHVTLFLDEIQQYMKREHQDMQSLLNTGYRRGWPAFRVEEDKDGRRTVKQFATFGFKAMNGTRDLVDTLRSRCILESMSRLIRKVLGEEIDREWARALREKLLMYRFKTLTENKPLEKPGLFKGRLKELFDPLLIVAPVTGKNSIIEQARKIEELIKEEEEMSIDAIVFQAIMRVYQETQDEKLLINDISKVLNEKLTDSDDIVTNVAIGMVAKRLGFQKCLKSNSRAIRWNAGLVMRLIQRYGDPTNVEKLLGEGSKGQKRFRKATREWVNWEVKKE